QHDLLEVVGTGRAVRGLADLLDSGDQQADQDGDDGDHHQQFDQRERPSLGRSPENSSHEATSGNKKKQRNNLRRRLSLQSALGRGRAGLPEVPRQRWAWVRLRVRLYISESANLPLLGRVGLSWRRGGRHELVYWLCEDAVNILKFIFHL